MTQLEILHSLTLITDPSVLQAIRDFNSANVHLDFNQPTAIEAQEQFNKPKPVEAQEQFNKAKPVELEEQFNQAKLDNIKKEGGQSQKQKCDDFKSIWSSINIKRRKGSTGLSTTVGSPVKGKISTRDAPEENIKDLVPNKLSHIKLGDSILVKSSSSGKNQAQKVSSLVSTKYTLLLSF